MDRVAEFLEVRPEGFDLRVFEVRLRCSLCREPRLPKGDRRWLDFDWL